MNNNEIIYPEPTLTDDDVDVFIGWLIQQKSIGPSMIELVANALTSLKNDRALLAQKLKEMGHV